MSLEDNLTRVVERYAELAALMSQQGDVSPDEYVRLAKEYAELTPVVEAVEELRGVTTEIADLDEMIAAEEGAEMRALAQEERAELGERLPTLEQQLQVLLLPRDEADWRNAILEVRAGTGGDEAALFAADLYRMYQRYAENRGWKIEVMAASDTGLGGIKEVVVSISGKDVFSRLKFESGVHRVQRVPETESSGRIHTSAATVAVLAEAEEVDVRIDEKDLRIDTYRSQGAGGQHVNTTDSAVRITHLPSRTVVTCQDEKSQHKNKAKAMKILRARLFELERTEREAALAAERKSKVGTGDRSQRIRTYNFPQGRVTDHRIGLTLHKLPQVLAGDLDELIDALMAEDQAARMAAP